MCDTKWRHFWGLGELVAGKKLKLPGRTALGSQGFRGFQASGLEGSSVSTIKLGGFGASGLKVPRFQGSGNPGCQGLGFQCFKV